MATAKRFEIGSATQRARDLNQYGTSAGMRRIVGVQFKAAGRDQHRLPSMDYRCFRHGLQWRASLIGGGRTHS
jgi:hypothetical protein